MVAAVINAAVSAYVEDKGATTVLKGPADIFTPRDEPLEQTKKRLEACVQFPAAPPAGNA